MLTTVPVITTLIFHQINGLIHHSPVVSNMNCCLFVANITNAVINIFVSLGLWLPVIIFLSDVSQVGTSKVKFLKGGKVLKWNLHILDITE